MHDKPRYLQADIERDLKEKMVFLGGPRQVGKTTLAFQLLESSYDAEHPAYLNWDFAHVRPTLLRGELPVNQKLVVFDEIHKYKGWRNLVKGFYDQYRKKKQFLITGSARLDYYRRGGDSLQGRYHYYRLHPFSLNEINKKPTMSDLERLLKFGGFPEPFLKANETHYKRWQLERVARVIQEDLISLESVQELSQLELLAQVLPGRVGSPLSVASLREDLSVAFETVERWLMILERLYYCYRISPYGVKTLRAVKKSKKLYLWDWSQCEDVGARFENLVASHLLKYCHYRQDTEGDVWELCFLRDAMQREIDFVVLKNAKPQFAVECKVGDKMLSPHIRYFLSRTAIPLYYQVHTKTKDVELEGGCVRILPFMTLARDLKI